MSRTTAEQRRKKREKQKQSKERKQQELNIEVQKVEEQVNKEIKEEIEEEKKKDAEIKAAQAIENEKQEEKIEENKEKAIDAAVDIIENVAARTLTDEKEGMYPGADLDQLLDNKLVVDGNGQPFILSGTKQDRYAALEKAMKSPEGIYVQNIADGNKKTEMMVQVKMDDQKNISKEAFDGLIIDSEIKTEVLEQLQAVKTDLENMNPPESSIKSLQKNITGTIDKLKSCVKENEFSSILNEFTADADKYYLSNTQLKMTADRSSKITLTSKIRNLRDSVEERTLPSDNVKSPTDALKERVAIKYMHAYVAMAKDIQPKNQTDYEVKKYTERLAREPQLFNKQVQNLIKNDKAFNYLYGGNTKESLDRLKSAATDKAANIFKSVQKELKNPTPERLAHEKKMSAQFTAKTRSTTNYKMTPENREALTKGIKELNKQIQDIGYKSKDLDELKQELIIADIRLGRNNSRYMNESRMMNKIGALSDKLITEIAGKSSISSKELKLLTNLEKLKDLSDKTCSGKEVQVLADSEAKERVLADRFTGCLNYQLINSKNPQAQEDGKFRSVNTDEFDKFKENMMSTKAFQELVSDAKTVDKILSKDQIEEAFGKYLVTANQNGEIKPKAQVKQQEETQVQKQSNQLAK